ncbi:MAG TPA: hypothetical protein VF131_18615 [Blastocatellia bacterium]|nr:hypothetical protein [Blastocatellia bacterium]
MRTSIIGVILSVTLLAATTRASHYDEPRSGDEPAAIVSTVEKDNKQQDQPSTPKDATASKPTKAQLKEEKRVRDIKNRIRRMGVARRITVVLLNENERYGSIEQIDDEGIQLAEVDTKQEVKVYYKDIKKVRTGYGTFVPLVGKRVNPKWELFAKLAVPVFIILMVSLSVRRL